MYQIYKWKVMLINDENNHGIRVQSTLSLIIFDMRKLCMSLPTQNNKGTYVRNFFLQCI